MPTPSVRRVPYSSLTFNPAAQRYISPQGRFISAESVRTTIDNDIDHHSERLQAHGNDLKTAAAQFKAGSISQDAYNDAVRDWRNDMAASLKGLHLGNAAAAKGGFHAMESADFGRVGGLLRPQYAYLENFAIEVAANPDIVLNEASGKQNFDDRVDSYAQAGRHTFEAVSSDEHLTNGFQSVENIMEHDGHNCTGDESCQEQTDLGRISINDRRRILQGRRKCKNKCRCRNAYFKEAA